MAETIQAQVVEKRENQSGCEDECARVGGRSALKAGRGLEADGNSSGSSLSQRGGSAAPRRGKEWEPLVQCLWNTGVCWSFSGWARALGSCQCHLCLEIPLEQFLRALGKSQRKTGENPVRDPAELQAGCRFTWIPALLHSRPSLQW